MNCISDKLLLCKQFITDNHSGVGKFIMGINPTTRSIINALPNIVIDGIIDEFTDAKEFMGIQIIHSIKDIPCNSIVLSVARINPVTIKKKIIENNLKYIDLFLLIKSFPELPILKIPFWDGFNKSYIDRRNEYDLLYRRLADNESKVVLHHLIDFRLSYDVSAMEIFSDQRDKQYFEPFLNLSTNYSFIDVGGFDGYTTKEFIKRCPDYKKVWYFEPEEGNLEKSKALLSNYERIIFCPFAASDQAGQLHFEPANDASKVSENGSVVVNSQLIDNYISDDILNEKLFIKMDIEGGESKAITGAQNTVRKYHPTMAIAVYHKGADLIDIPKQVLAIRNDYDLFLRHYTEGTDETVMFFVPNEG